MSEEERWPRYSPNCESSAKETPMPNYDNRTLRQPN